MSDYIKISINLEIRQWWGRYDKIKNIKRK
jgi:hypothetical protein